MGNASEEILSTLANRLIMWQTQINEREKLQLAQHADGKTSTRYSKQLLNTYDPDTVDGLKLKLKVKTPEHHLMTSTSFPLSTLNS